MQPSTIPPIVLIILKVFGKCLHCLHYICKVPPFCLHCASTRVHSASTISHRATSGTSIRCRSRHSHPTAGPTSCHGLAMRS